MASSRTLTFTIVGETRDAEDALERVAGKTESTESRMSGSFGGIAKAAAGAFAADKIIDFGREMLDTALHAEAVGRRVSTVFGDNADDIRQWADDNNESFGMSTAGAEDMAARIGDLLVPLGFTREEAAALAPEIAEVGAAIAEAAGRDKVEGIEAIGSALVGERESLKGFGVVIKEADLNAEHLDGTFAGLTASTEKQEDALNTLEEITRQSADALTLWEGRGETLRGEVDELTAAYEDLKLMLAEELAPTMVEAFGQANALAGAAEGDWSAVGEAVRQGAVWFGELTERATGIHNPFLDLAAAMGDVETGTKNLVTLTKEQFSPELERATNKLEAEAEAARKAEADLEKMRSKVDEMRETQKRLSDFQEQEAKRAADDLRESYRKLKESIEDSVSGVDGATEELELSLDEFEQNLRDSLAQQESFWANVRTLQELGLDDLAQSFIDEGPRTAGILAEVVTDWERAASLEDLIEQGQTQGAEWASAVARGAVETTPVVVAAVGGMAQAARDEFERILGGLRIPAPRIDPTDEGSGLVFDPQNRG